MSPVVARRGVLRPGTARGFLLYLCAGALVALGTAYVVAALPPLGSGAAIFAVLAAVGFAGALALDRQTAEREVMESSLAESEQRLRDFAESASDWFWEQDADLRFTRFSGGGRYAQFTSREDLGRTRREVVRDATITAEEWQAHDDDLRARRPFQNFRFRRPLGNGQVIHVAVSGIPIFDAPGRFRGYRGTGRDVTAEVAAEQELARRVEERTAELRRAQDELLRKERLSTLGQLTATVAHELRNPLSAMRNTIFIIRETVTKANIELERPIARIERNIARCDRIISDLLDFTRLRALNRVPLDFDRWLDDVLAEQRLPPGVSLERDLGAPGCRLSFDGERMRRVIVNLVDNAVQAMTGPEHGSGDRWITVRTRRAGREFEFSVADSGPGIPDDLLPKVFEPLFSTKAIGTGLGLPTVKQIVELHGGRVVIASPSDQGTRVTVILPDDVATREVAA